MPEPSAPPLAYAGAIEPILPAPGATGGVAEISVIIISPDGTPYGVNVSQEASFSYGATPDEIKEALRVAFTETYGTLFPGIVLVFMND